LDPRAAAGADVLRPNETKPQVWPYARWAPYLDLGAIGQFSTRIAVGHVPARRCVSKLAKLEYLARFQSKMGTVLIGRETMCDVILRGEVYWYLSKKDRGRWWGPQVIMTSEGSYREY
jgi:hypothetical protein